ncbi:ribosome-associated translation inhibitor RaiA [Acetobacter farinalis]|uniref:Ribosome hibernation promoting factor n=1 Tax=Acetobacter farinalis TaxID=1260984 RepID=A0ABT3Q3R0_9PROT|nr:ribosome-associated translation inhibitor RaiA [Acetobacter farinalis]MCX2559861.1 ribosome-associated translation inhibitor RaiA [Acetobacter farinalis]NHO28522.1 ribosome-associated translation inhibitor RaiA [Acetobacter farinalis]
MHIHVSGKQIDLSDALKHRVNAHLGGLAERYFDKALEAKVTFSKARSFFTCDINVHAGRGLTLRGEGEAADANAAFDDAAEHIAKRLRRYHRRVTSHARASKNEATHETGRSYVLKSSAVTPSAQTQPDNSTDHEAAAEAETYAAIIAEHTTDIPSLSVSEAVMRLDLAACGILLFRNRKNQQINLVYRRDDGNIGWVDTGPS